jgi:hypothetical protein
MDHCRRTPLDDPSRKINRRELLTLAITAGIAYRISASPLGRQV